MKRWKVLFLVLLLMLMNIKVTHAQDVTIKDRENTQIHLKKGEVRTLVFDLDTEINESEIYWENPNSNRVELKLVNDKWTISGLNYGSAYLTGYYDGVPRFYVLVQIFDTMLFKSDVVQLDIYETFKSDLVFQPASNLEQFRPTYTSSDETIASVDGDGVITAHKIGKVTITASYLDVSAVKNVEVIDRPDFAYLDPKQVINVDSSVNIPYRLSIFQEGIDKTIVWSSSDPRVATVDQRGIVYGHDNGVTTITARVNNKEYTTNVEVISNVEDIIIHDKEIRIAVGEERMVRFNVLPQAYSDTPITWLSSRPSVVSVTNGQLYGVGTGEAMVTARINQIEKEVKVIVTNPLTGITVNPSRLTLQQGQRFHLRVQPKPSDSSDKLLLSFNSSHPEVVSVDDYGNVTANSQGTAIIFVKHDTFSANMEITVVPAEDEQGQRVVIGSLNNNQVVTFDLRGIENLKDYILEIPFVTKINRIGQLDVIVQLDESAYSQRNLNVFGLQLGEAYKGQDIALTVVDQENQRLFTYQLYNFRQIKQNLFPHMGVIESTFSNFNNHLIEVDVPINLNGMDSLTLNSQARLNEDYRIYMGIQKDLRLVSARPIRLSDNNYSITLSDLETNFYYLTDQPLQSRIAMFLFIIAAILALLTSFFLIRRYNEQEIVLEEEKRSRDESVNYQQQKENR